MPFVQKDRSGSWISLRDVAQTGKTVRVVKGFLEDDDTNEYRGKVLPRHVIHGTIEGDEYQIGSPKTGSRPADLKDMEAFLFRNPEGYIDFTVEEIPLEGGNTYNKINVVDSLGD